MRRYDPTSSLSPTFLPRGDLDRSDGLNFASGGDEVIEGGELGSPCSPEASLNPARALLSC